jgi:hypothetical protein
MSSMSSMSSIVDVRGMDFFSLQFGLSPYYIMFLMPLIIFCLCRCPCMTLDIAFDVNNEADLPHVLTVTKSLISARKVLVIAGAGISTSSGIPVNLLYYLTHLSLG